MRGRRARYGRRSGAPPGGPERLGSLAGRTREADGRARHPHPGGWLGAYTPLSDRGYRPRPRTQGIPERAAKILPHIHRVFGNLKTWLRGTHHGVGHDHLQAYLNGSTFRFNRRLIPMSAFQTLLGLVSGVHGPTGYDML